MKKLMLLILICFAFSNLKASNYFVSTTGNDANTGSFSNPWKSIQHGLDMAQAGDTVFIRGGEYNEQLFSQRDGTANARIVLCGFQNEQVIIDGTGTGANNGLQITHSYISLINIEVRDWADTGIWIYGNIGFISVLNCKVHDCPYCLSLSDGVHDFFVDNTLTYNFGPASGGGDGFGFSCEPNGVPCYNGLITNCKSYNGLSELANNDGFALGHHDVSNITFRNCETYNVFDGFDISGYNILLDRCSAHDIPNGDGAYKIWPDSVTLINCIGYHATSIVQLDYDGRNATANLFNCTFHDAIGGGYNIWIENPTTSHLNMYNCIISGGDNRGFTFEQDLFTNYNGDYNIFQNDDSTRVISTNTQDLSPSQIQSGAWTTLSGQDAHSIAFVGSETLFLDDNGVLPNLHLKTGSPAINSGTNLHAPPVDYSNCLRDDGLIDIGAYEYGCTGQGFNIIPVLQKNLMIFPYPANETLTIRADAESFGMDYTINDGTGRNVLTGKISGENTTVGINQLSAGMYLLQVGDGNKQAFKVIKN